MLDYESRMGETKNDFFRTFLIWEIPTKKCGKNVGQKGMTDFRNVAKYSDREKMKLFKVKIFQRLTKCTQACCSSSPFESVCFGKGNAFFFRGFKYIIEAQFSSTRFVFKLIMINCPLCWLQMSTNPQLQMMNSVESDFLFDGVTIMTKYFRSIFYVQSKLNKRTLKKKTKHFNASSSMWTAIKYQELIMTVSFFPWKRSLCVGSALFVCTCENKRIEIHWYKLIR